MTVEQLSKDRKRWIVLGILCLSLFIISIDNMVLNLALPAISSDLGSTASDLQWITDAYILVFASLMLTMGAIGDRWGRKLILQIGLALFGIGSLAAALSTSNEMLIICRAFLGFGGAMVMPSTLSIVTDTFRHPVERGRAIAIWASVFSLGAGFGPVIGGYLIEYFDWNAVFYINIPIVIIALISGFIFIHESTGEGAPKPDLPGVVLSTGGLFALIYGIIKAGEDSWGDSTVIISLLVAATVLGIFVWWEHRSRTPMLPLGYFKNRSFSGAALAMLLTVFALLGSLFFLSQYLQTVQGYSPVSSALRMLPLAGTAFVATLLSAKVAEMLGNKIAVALGIIICGAGLYYCSQMFDADTSYPVLVSGIVIIALGIGTVMSPATNAIQGSLPLSRVGIGSAMNDTSRQVGGALGVALLGALMNATYLDKVGNLQVLTSLPEEAAEAVRSSVQGAHIIAGTLPPDMAQEVIQGANEAFTVGMTDAMFIGALIMVVCAGISFFMLPRRARILKEHEDQDGRETP